MLQLAPLPPDNSHSFYACPVAGATFPFPMAVFTEGAVFKSLFWTLRYVPLATVFDGYWVHPVFYFVSSNFVHTTLPNVLDLQEILNN